VIQYGHTRRVFKTLPVGHKKVELAVDIPRLFCKDCGAIRQANLEFAKPKKHYTKSLEQFVIDLCRVMTLQDAAELPNGWGPQPGRSGTGSISTAKAETYPPTARRRRRRTNLCNYARKTAVFGWRMTS